MIQHFIAELDHANADGPPVWDIEIPTLDGKPAPFRFAFGRVYPPVIKGAQPKLVTCLVFAVDPADAPTKRRIGLLTPTGSIPEPIASTATYLGTYLHPGNGSPIAAYEFPYVALEDMPIDEAFDTSDEDKRVVDPESIAEIVDRVRKDAPPHGVPQLVVDENHGAVVDNQGNVTPIELGGES